jgi:sec-independent protein translocase protein TatA
MFAFLEGPELIIVVVLVLLLFGGSQLPKLAKNIGKAQQEFKSGLADGAKDAGKPAESGEPKSDSPSTGS